MDNGDNVFPFGSSPVLGGELSLGDELPIYDELNEDGDGSMNLALDNSCSSPGSTSINKRRIKSRENAACKDRSSSVYLPENFMDLSGALQASIFQNFMCPTSRFPHAAYRPVCSSAIEDDTQMFGYLSGFTAPIHFTLYHSLPSSYSPPDPLILSFYSSWV